MATLKDKLEKEDKKQVVCWSNGNIFRSVTLLAVTWCEQQDDCGGKFVPEKALTKENLANFMSMLEFGKVRKLFDCLALNLKHTCCMLLLYCFDSLWHLTNKQINQPSIYMIVQWKV